MLKETKPVRQIPGEPFRRWYKDSETDLIVWLDKHRVVGFQLIVPNGIERAVITWAEGRGLSLSGLDDGEGRAGCPKMTQVLVKVQSFDGMAASRHFKAVSGELPSGLVHLIEQKIAEVET